MSRIFELFNLSKRCVFFQTIPKQVYRPQVPITRFKKLENSNTYAALISLGGLFSFFKSEEEEEEPDLITTMKKGILAMRRDQFDKAESLYHDALKMAQEQNNLLAITYCYDLMGNLAFDRNEFEKARVLFVHLMQRLMASGQAEDSNEMIHLSLKMAKIHEETNKIQEARLGYQYCLTKLQSKHESVGETEDSAMLMALVLHWYAKFLTTEKQYHDAIRYMRQALDIVKSTIGEENDQTVILLGDLATVVDINGDLDSSFELQLKAVDLVKKLEIEDEFPHLFINLGRLYFKKGMLSEAKSVCSKGYYLASQNSDQESYREARHCLEEINESMVT